MDITQINTTRKKYISLVVHVAEKVVAYTRVWEYHYRNAAMRRRPFSTATVFCRGHRPIARRGQQVALTLGVEMAVVVSGLRRRSGPKDRRPRKALGTRILGREPPSVYSGPSAYVTTTWPPPSDQTACPDGVNLLVCADGVFRSYRRRTSFKIKDLITKTGLQRRAISFIHSNDGITKTGFKNQVN